MIDTAGVRYGVLGVCLALAIIAIVLLWRHLVKRDDQIAAERKATADAEQARAVRDVERDKTAALRAVEVDRAWEARLATLKLETEQRCRELSEKYAEELAEVVRQNRDNEAKIRAEHAATIQVMARENREAGAAANAAAEKTAGVLEKLTDRLMPARAGRRPGEY